MPNAQRQSVIHTPEPNPRAKYRSDNILVVLAHRTIGNASKLRKMLRNYPIYALPHPQKCATLSATQALANFDFFMKEKNKRTSLIVDILAQFDITADPGKPNRHSMMALDGWAYQQWPAIYKRKIFLSCRQDFLQRGKNAMIRSFLFDMSLFLGECYLGVDPDAAWMLDNADLSRTIESATFNRIVLRLPPRDDQIKDDQTGECQSENVNNLLCMEDQVLYHYGAQKGSSGFLEAEQKIGRVLGEPILAKMRP